MTITWEEIAHLLQAPEGEHLEFKEAKNDYDSEELVRYCAALANEGGGKLVLGVTDKAPRRVVGSTAFRNVEGIKRKLVDDLRIRVDVETVDHPDGRVLLFVVPAHPIGVPIQYRGAYWMRAGDTMAPMTLDRLRAILAEAGPDFTAETCPGASLPDLDPVAVARFRAAWRRKSGNPALDVQADEQILADAELAQDGQVTYAALVLLGSRAALGRYLAAAEVVFEYRSSDNSVAFQQRQDYRAGFFVYHDDLWRDIDLRNDIQHFQDGLFVWDIATFNEAVVREAILNAVSHRDYRLGGSIFVRQYPKRLEIVSPGGFPPGINPANVLWRQSPRNRRVAEALARCGLVERSGQGMDRMFGESIRESKRPPDFAGTDEYQVSVMLRGEVRDAAFLRFLERAARERQFSFGTDDLLVLDLLHGDGEVPERLRPRLAHLAEHGVVEKVGRGRSSRYVLSRQFYAFLGKKGVYTRKRGLDRDTNKALLLKHIQENRREGSQFQEFAQVLPALSRHQIATLLREMQRQDQVHCLGRTRAARWYPGRSAPEGPSVDSTQS